MASESAGASGYSVDYFKQMLRLRSNAEILLDKEFVGQQTVRRLINTPLGTMAIRWPFQLTRSLQFSPENVVQEASVISSRILELQQVPDSVRQADYDWSIAFVSGLSAKAIGKRQNSDYYHLAWMGPPADIVLDVHCIENRCQGFSGANPKAARREVVRALVHEIGHAVEYRLMGNAFSHRGRWHSEGFATWFEAGIDEARSNPMENGPREQNAPPPNNNRKLVQHRAKLFFQKNWKPYFFQDTPADYAQSYAMVASLARDGNHQRLFQVYRRMSDERCTFQQAVERELGWTWEQWMDEAEAFVGQL